MSEVPRAVLVDTNMTDLTAATQDGSVVRMWGAGFRVRIPQASGFRVSGLRQDSIPQPDPFRDLFLGFWYPKYSVSPVDGMP